MGRRASKMEEPLLSIRHLTVDLQSTKKRSLQVLQNISLTVHRGEVVGIVGESGCGKSVLSQTIVGLQPKTMNITEGTVAFDGNIIDYKSERQLRMLRGNDISMIFQNPMSSLNPSLTIGRQVSEMFRLHKKMSRAEAYTESIELLQSVGLSRVEQLIKDYPHQLSGGMQQRIMISIALACQPKLLIADEPTTALDVTIQAQILALMKKACEERDTAVLLISHDLGVMAKMCDRIIVMYAGEIVETGTVQQVIHESKHPYTQGLIKSLPAATKQGDKLYAIPGTVPRLENRSDGCPFISRCNYESEECSIKPTSRFISEGHEVKCHNLTIGGVRDEPAVSRNP